MGIFSAVSGANPNGGGVYFVPGSYRVRIEACKSIKSRLGQDLFVVEATILESSVPERQAGMKCSQVINLSKHESAPGNIRGFLAAALNAPIEQVGENEAEAAVSPLNPLAGTEMRLTCVLIKTKAGADFTLHQWSYGAAPQPGAQQVVVPQPGVPPAAWQPHPSEPRAEWNPATGATRWRQ